eukprot:CAMPEP_0114111418 /NCGR_PEP_ID=MMETSP0043_2-20121206/1844_1 /TAXON_ID=464988 /ORGANISM="Hemiselmis andersenii, Strain CCMP644" /LENGTH=70 /DNA_ID=CAMNT_0001203451 /DNA_START=229 /DNA_END=437 /DNA_ORIENTATION=+
MAEGGMAAMAKPLTRRQLQKLDEHEIRMLERQGPIWQQEADVLMVNRRPIPVLRLSRAASSHRVATFAGL